VSKYRCIATGCPLEGVLTEESHSHVRNLDGSIGMCVTNMRNAPPPPPSLPVATVNFESDEGSPWAVLGLVAGCVVVALAIYGLLALVGVV